MNNNSLFAIVSGCLLSLSSFGATQVAGLPEGNVLIVLHPTRSKALTVENSGVVTVPTGTLQVFSKNRSAVSLQNTGEVTIDVVALAGGVTMTPGAKANSRQNLRLKESVDPLANLPEIKTEGLPSHGVVALSTGETQLEPGIYDGIFLGGNAKVVLAPGFYIIEHELALNNQSKITGAGVTLINQGEFHLDNSCSIELSAPKDGATQGIAVWQPRANNRNVRLAASATATIRGAIYLPTGALYLQSSAQLQCTQLIADAVSVLNSAQLLVK